MIISLCYAAFYVVNSLYSIIHKLFGNLSTELAICRLGEHKHFWIDLQSRLWPVVVCKRWVGMRTLRRLTSNNRHRLCVAMHEAETREKKRILFNHRKHFQYEKSDKITHTIFRTKILCCAGHAALAAVLFIDEYRQRLLIDSLCSAEDSSCFDSLGLRSTITTITIETTTRESDMISDKSLQLCSGTWFL